MKKFKSILSQTLNDIMEKKTYPTAFINKSIEFFTPIYSTKKDNEDIKIEVDEKVAEYDEKIGENIAIITEIKETFDTFDTQINDFQTRADMIENSFDEINDNISDLEISVETHQAGITTLQTELSTTNNNVDALGASILNFATVGYVDEKTSDKATITQLNTANANIGTAQNDITTLQTGLASANTNITGLQTNMNTANGNISALQSSMTTTNGNIGTAQNDITTLQTGLTTTNNNVNALSSSIAGFATTGYVDEKTSDKATITQLNTANWNIGTAQNDITTLQTGLASANTNITGLQTSMNTANGNISALQSNMTTANWNIGTAQNDITTLQNGLTTTNNNVNALSSSIAGFATTGYVDEKTSDKATITQLNTKLDSEWAINRFATQNQVEDRVFIFTYNTKMSEIDGTIATHGASIGEVGNNIFNVQNGLRTIIGNSPNANNLWGKILTAELDINQPNIGLKAMVATIDNDLNDGRNGLKDKVSTIDGDINNTRTGIKVKVATIESDLNDANGIKSRMATVETTLNHSTTGLKAIVGETDTAGLRGKIANSDNYLSTMNTFFQAVANRVGIAPPPTFTPVGNPGSGM